jgi:hypothetical protein
MFHNESFPYLRAEPSGRGGHRVWWSAVGVASNSLSGFKGPVIFQKIRDTGRPERVGRIVSWQSSLFKPSFEHIRCIGTHKRPAR